MANERENNTNYTIYENGPLGEVPVSYTHLTLPTN